MSDFRTLLRASDLEVVDDFRRTRSEASARVLIERFSPVLLRTAACMLGAHHHSAEDVVQDTWIRAFGAIDQYRADAALGTWLTRIVIRQALDHLRRSRAGALISLDEAREAPAESIDLDFATDLDGALTHLSAHPRSVFVMHDIEGFTHNDIARELGIAVGDIEGSPVQRAPQVARIASPHPQ